MVSLGDATINGISSLANGLSNMFTGGNLHGGWNKDEGLPSNLRNAFASGSDDGGDVSNMRGTAYSYYKNSKVSAPTASSILNQVKSHDHRY